MANTSVWSSYSGHHLLLLEWTDWNSDELVQISEILVKYLKIVIVSGKIGYNYLVGSHGVLLLNTI